jgi:penicillin amidase
MGNIAWFNGNELPIREDLANFTVDGLPPFFIRDGTGAAANEWLPVMNPQPNQAANYEILPFAEMPQLINPAKGFVLNANNDPVGVTLDNVPYNEVRPSGQGLYYLGPYFAANRMGRLDREVKAMIDAGHKITLDDMKALQANVEMLDAELVLPTLLGIMSQVPVPPGSPMEQALDVLSTWDYSANTGLGPYGWDAFSDPTMAPAPSLEQVRNSAAATVWAMWRSMLVQNTMYATLEAIGLGDYLPSSRAAYRAFTYHLLNYPTAGGVGASGIPFFSAGLGETVAGSLQMALDKLASDEFAPAYANSTNVLDYAWGKLHRIVFDHTLGGPFNIPNWGPFMDLSPELPGFARQGGYDVLDASGHSATADGLNEFMFGSGPARRFVADMGPVMVNAQQMIAGGQSGIVTEPNYGQGLFLWLTNTYHPMTLGEAYAAGAAVVVTTFGPAAAATAEEN